MIGINWFLALYFTGLETNCTQQPDRQPEMDKKCEKVSVFNCS
jgi:hypothetical protein